MERVLGRSGQGSFHPEVLKMSFGLLQFLATNFSLTTENVDALWEDTKDKHCSRHVFSNLSELSKYLEEDLVSSLRRRDYFYLYNVVMRDVFNSGRVSSG